MDLPSKHHARIPAPLNPWKPAAGASFRPRSASKLPTLTHTAFTKTHKMMCQLEIGRMMVVKNRLFLGDTERTIPRSRPAFRIAGSAGRVKGAKRDRSHAQRSEHGQDPPFDAPEHPATIASGWAGRSGFRLQRHLQRAGSGSSHRGHQKACSRSLEFAHDVWMATPAKRKRRLWDAYAFRDFRPQPTVRGLFGDPKARIIRLTQRKRSSRM